MKSVRRKMESRSVFTTIFSVEDIEILGILL